MSGLGVNDEYGTVGHGGAALVSSGAVIRAIRCANSQYQTERQQQADGHTAEVQIPIESLFFVFHDYSSLDFVANIVFCR
jgi:hypothetical protein